MPVSSELFRGVVGSFPTGVTIVTAMGEDGVPRGLTSNAVCSVSADPPLLLICVDKRSHTLPAIQAIGAFAVNFLATGRGALSDRFASKGADKFAGIAWNASKVARGAPILTDDIVACAECLVTQAIEAGDHWVFIGSIEAGTVTAGTPLMYWRRAYAAWPEPDAVLVSAES